MALGVMNFSKDEHVMEDQLPGRPARRTIGRKNGDMAQVILKILGAHLILCGAFYGLPDFRNYLGDAILMIGVAVVVGIAFFVVTPANRLGHAYAISGQLAVIHLCCGLSAFTLIGYFLHGNEVTRETMILLFAVAIGTMLIFSKSQIEKTKIHKREF